MGFDGWLAFPRWIVYNCAGQRYPERPNTMKA